MRTIRRKPSRREKALTEAWFASMIFMRAAETFGNNVPGYAPALNACAWVVFVASLTAIGIDYFGIRIRPPRSSG